MIDREKKDGREMRLSRAAEAKTEREKRRITEITGIPIACHEASQRHDQTRLRKKSSFKMGGIKTWIYRVQRGEKKNYSPRDENRHRFVVITDARRREQHVQQGFARIPLPSPPPPPPPPRGRREASRALNAHEVNRRP